MSPRITQHCKTAWKRNRLSGHEWPEHTLINRWDVISSSGFRQTCNSYEAAERELERVIAFEAKFPFNPVYSEREIEKAKKLGLWREHETKTC